MEVAVVYISPEARKVQVNNIRRVVAVANTEWILRTWLIELLYIDVLA